ncbi:MAG: hypothetical protein RL011_894 [Pseudomonadota bacterium]
MSAVTRLFIVDAMALAFRSFYALGKSSLSSSNGLPTGAIYGSAMFMHKLVTEEKPDYLLAVSDTPEPTFRHKRFPAYKANRGEMPSDLAEQSPYIFTLLENFGCPLLKIPGLEADDGLAAAAKRLSKPDVHTYTVSGDKDFMQIVSDQIFMYVPKKNEDAMIVGTHEVRERFHCSPDQVVDVLAIIGDPVDNVPGVHGIGEKGAAKLIESYGSLANVYEHLDEIAGKKQKEALIQHRDDAFLSRELVTLKTDIDFPIGLDELRCDWRVASANQNLLGLYQKLGFKTLGQRVKDALTKDVPADLTAEPNRDPKDTGIRVTTICDDDSFQTCVKELELCDIFAFVIVSSGSDIIADRATEFTLVTSSQMGFQIPLTEAGIYFTRQILNLPINKCTHGLKSALEALANCGIFPARPITDLEISDYLIDPNNYDHSLESMHERYSITVPLGLNPADRAAVMVALIAPVAKNIRDLNLERVLNDIELPLVQVLCAMERQGVFIDAEYLATYSDELDKLSTDLEQKIHSAAGALININSSKQLQDLLFQKLKLHEVAGIKRLKKTKTGFSTDESVLSQLAAVHPVPELILQYRTVNKLKSTYVDALPQYLNPRTHRIHTRFNQTVAATGRLSSDRPNLQNIPIQSSLGRKIREAFKPAEADHVLISADYSQVEIRLLAHLANATDLIDAFKLGLDVHRVTAAKIFSIPEAEVTDQLRSQAKAVNFGIIYGMGPQRLAAQTGVTLTAAREFIQRYFEVYPGIKSYTLELIEFAKRHGYCLTMMGRRRPIPELRDANQALQSRGENIAVNAPIQGSAADVIKLAMINVHALLRTKRFKTTMLLQVHDELVFSAPESELPDVVPLIRGAMESAVETRVPLKVDISWGANWLSAH